PDEPVLSDQEIEEDERDRDPHGDVLRWVAIDQDRIVGAGRTYLPRPDSPNFAENARFLYAHGAALGPWRHRGVGTRLLAHVHELMLRHDKSILTTGTQEPDGHGFLRHIGAIEKTRAIENRLLLGDVDWVTLEEWVTAALASLPSSSFAHHGPRVTNDIYKVLSSTLNELWEDIPFDQLERPRIRLETSMIDEWQRYLDRVNGTEHFIILQDAHGSVVGISHVAWFSRTPDRVYQMFTGVRRDERGSGYAKALK